MPKAYVVVEIDVQDAAAYERYKALAPAAIAAHGGRYLVRGGSTETLEGGWAPPRFVILEFPSAAAGRAWWGSREYASARAIRHASAHSRMVLAEGLEPDADPASAARRSSR